MFNYEIACQLADRFAAIVSYTGTMTVNPDSCGQLNPTQIMHVHGKADRIIAYGKEWDWKAWDSIGTLREIRGLVDFWDDKYHCKKFPTRLKPKFNTSFTIIAIATQELSIMASPARTTTDTNLSMMSQCTKFSGFSQRVPFRLEIIQGLRSSGSLVLVSLRMRQPLL